MVARLARLTREQTTQAYACPEQCGMVGDWWTALQWPRGCRLERHRLEDYVALLVQVGSEHDVVQQPSQWPTDDGAAQAAGLVKVVLLGGRSVTPSRWMLRRSW